MQPLGLLVGCGMWGLSAFVCSGCFVRFEQSSTAVESEMGREQRILVYSIHLVGVWGNMTSIFL